MDDLIQILLLLALTIVPSLFGSKNKKKKEAQRRRLAELRQQEELMEQLRNGNPQAVPDSDTAFAPAFTPEPAARPDSPMFRNTGFRQPVSEGSDGEIARKMQASEQMFSESSAESEKTEKEKIDLRKLVVYSEIMKPKYDEY